MVLYTVTPWWFFHTSPWVYLLGVGNGPTNQKPINLGGTYPTLLSDGWEVTIARPGRDLSSETRQSDLQPEGSYRQRD